MLHSGPAFSVTALGDGIVEVKFDLAGESVNKINALALQDFAAATQAIANDTSVKGIILTSGKGVFVVGADITEFGRWFADGPDAHRPAPGQRPPDPGALRRPAGAARRRDQRRLPRRRHRDGPGCDLPRDVRDRANIGLPEVKLGIFPGFGGTVRLPRVIGLDNAVEWIATGADRKADAALKEGAVDAVVAPDKLRDAALAMVRQCIAGELDWKARRAEKLAPLKLNKLEQTMAFKTAKGMVAAQAGPNYPAPVLRIEEHAGRRDAGPRRGARDRGEVFRAGGHHAAGQCADRRVPRRPGGQEGRQALGEERRETRSSRRPCSAPASWAAASPTRRPSRALPIVMKDIREEALALGMNEAGKLLAKQVEQGKMHARRR